MTPQMRLDNVIEGLDSLLTTFFNTSGSNSKSFYQIKTTLIWLNDNISREAINETVANLELEWDEAILNLLSDPLFDKRKAN